MISDIALSQAPLLAEYQAAVRSYWEASRHQENFDDMKEAAGECWGDMSTGARALLIGTVSANLVEISPLNETGYARVGGNVFRDTMDSLPSMEVGGIVGATIGNAWNAINETLPAAASVGAMTGPWELLIGTGVAYGVHRFRPVLDIVRERYIDKPKQADVDALTNKTNKIKNAVGVFGVALSTGASGVVLYSEARESNTDKQTKVNLRRPALAAGLLALNNTIMAAAILKVGTIMARTGGSDNPVETVSDVVSNPLIVLSLMGGAAYASGIPERHRVKQEVKRQMNATQEIASDSKIRLLGRVFGRKKSQATTMPSDGTLAD